MPKKSKPGMRTSARPMTLPQASKATGLRVGVLKRLCENNRLAGVHLVRGVLRVPRSTVDAIRFRAPTPSEIEERFPRDGE